MSAITKDEAKFREAMMAEHAWAEQHEGQIHYTQDSRRDDFIHQPGRNHIRLPAYLDCSSYFTYLVWRAMWEVYGHKVAALDPSGYGWSAVGNSTSIAAHAKKAHRVVALLEARKGDAADWSGKHVSVLVQRPSKDPKGPDRHLGTDALVSSHGNESGPAGISLKSEVAFEGVLPIFVRAWVKP